MPSLKQTLIIHRLPITSKKFGSVAWLPPYASDSTGRAAYERGYKVSIVEDCSSARTPLEHEFYCQNVFPLYGSVIESKALEVA
jgi:hypothetical protein